LKLDCVACHSAAAKGDRAGFPVPAQCSSCHAGRTFRIPSRRVYLLADYVIFSHARHTRADCASCHGPVNDRDRLTAEVSYSMKACMDCHRTHKATLTCNACHELGQ